MNEYILVSVHDVSIYSVIINNVKNVKFSEMGFDIRNDLDRTTNAKCNAETSDQWVKVQ